MLWNIFPRQVTFGLVDGIRKIQPGHCAYLFRVMLLSDLRSKMRKKIVETILEEIVSLKNWNGLSFQKKGISI